MFFFLRPLLLFLGSLLLGLDPLRFGGLPEPMLGWYVWSNEGFIGESLALAGARSPTFEVRELAPDGERDGIPLRSVVTRVKW